MGERTHSSDWHTRLLAHTDRQKSRATHPKPGPSTWRGEACCDCCDQGSTSRSPPPRDAVGHGDRLRRTNPGSRAVLRPSSPSTTQQPQGRRLPPRVARPDKATATGRRPAGVTLRVAAPIGCPYDTRGVSFAPRAATSPPPPLHSRSRGSLSSRHRCALQQPACRLMPPPAAATACWWRWCGGPRDNRKGR